MAVATPGAGRSGSGSGKGSSSVVTTCWAVPAIRDDDLHQRVRAPAVLPSLRAKADTAAPPLSAKRLDPQSRRGTPGARSASAHHVARTPRAVLSEQRLIFSDCRLKFVPPHYAVNVNFQSLYRRVRLEGHGGFYEYFTNTVHALRQMC